jgi:integrase/recombinase XerC/integrase/recombinase XerD
MEITLQHALERFSIALLADGTSQRTVSNYALHLAQLPASLFPWLAERSRFSLQTTSTDDLRDYILWLKRFPNHRGGTFAQATVDDYIRTMHRFFKWCAEEYGAHNPMHRIAYPKMAEPAIKTVTLDDVHKLLAACDESPAGIRNRAIILFLLDTGCRAAGLCGLSIAELDMNSRRAAVTEKGAKTRGIFFGDETHMALEKWLSVRSSVSPLFHHSRAPYSALTVNGLRIILAKLGKRAGVTGSINPHAFRHTFATLYAINGGDIASLQAQLGHRDLATTVRNYVHFSDDDMRDKHKKYSPISNLMRLYPATENQN